MKNKKKKKEIIVAIVTIFTIYWERRKGIEKSSNYSNIRVEKNSGKRNLFVKIS